VRKVDRSIQGSRPRHRPIATHVQLKQANGYLHDRTIPAVRPTRPLMASIRPLKYCDTRQKTPLPARHRVISKKRQCSIAPVWRRQSEEE
jgi:hypothetical protein